MLASFSEAAKAIQRWLLTGHRVCGVEPRTEPRVRHLTLPILSYQYCLCGLWEGSLTFRVALDSVNNWTLVRAAPHILCGTVHAELVDRTHSASFVGNLVMIGNMDRRHADDWSVNGSNTTPHSSAIAGVHIAISTRWVIRTVQSTTHCISWNPTLVPTQTPVIVAYCQIVPRTVQQGRRLPSAPRTLHVYGEVQENGSANPLHFFR
jgi:hypothetical protein